MNLLEDRNGSLSSRIISLFIVLIFDLVIVLISLLSQRDIPNNASNILITVTTACVPVALVGQVYQNIKDKEIKLNQDIDGDGKVG